MDIDDPVEKEKKYKIEEIKKLVNLSYNNDVDGFSFKI